MSENDSIIQLLALIRDVPRVFRKTFKKGDVVADYLEKRDRIFIMEEGEANLIKFDTKGAKYIQEHYDDHDLFGEIFHAISVSGEYSVIADSECTVTYFSLSDLTASISKSPRYAAIVELLLQIFSNKFEQLNFHIAMLSQRTIRDRLLTYFNDLAARNYQRVFYIPMSYTQLADYLSVDRSAMMREIKNLEDEGFIDRNKYRIRLLTNM